MCINVEMFDKIKAQKEEGMIKQTNYHSCYLNEAFSELESLSEILVDKEIQTSRRPNTNLWRFLSK